MNGDLQNHPSLVMDSNPIMEAETLYVFGLHCLTWAAIIDKMVLVVDSVWDAFVEFWII